MPVLDDADQQDGEGLDGGDKPPISRGAALNAAPKPFTAAALKYHNNKPTFPDSRPPSSNSLPFASNGANHNAARPANGYAPAAPSPMPRPRAPSAASSSPGYSSDSDSVSIGSSRPPSRADDSSLGGGISSRRPSSSKPSRPPSVKSLKSDDGQKFNLKDLLGSGLKRRGSARSDTSSRRSDSDQSSAEIPEGSTASLLKKYGVCGRVAIGKGATSVVRLAHKWDKSEEKLYAVKVRLRSRHAHQQSSHSRPPLPYLPATPRRNSAREERTRPRKNTSRNLHPSSASRRRCTTRTSSRPSISSRTRTTTGARSWSTAPAVTSTPSSRRAA